MKRCKNRSASAALLALYLPLCSGLPASAAPHPATRAPVAPSGAVVYDLSIKAADPDAQPVTTRFVVLGGKVRIGGATAKRVYLFQDHTMTVIDNTASVVHQLKHATFAQFTTHYQSVLEQLESAAAQSDAAGRAEADKKVADLKVALQRLQDTTVRNYRLTGATDTVDGHVCRIWEERENDIKHLELCVVPTESMPGAAQILEGLKTLSEFREGSKFAFGIDLATSPWWSDIFRFGGLPVMIHEYRYETPANDITLTAVHTGVPAAGAFDLPAAYKIEEGPDYTTWYVR